VEITHLCHPLHNVSVRSFFPRDPSSPSRRCRAPLPLPAVREQYATTTLPSVGRSAGPPETPEISRPPPPPPPPLNSSRRIGLSRPPPLTLDASDVNGAAAAGDEEENGAHGAIWEDSIAPFSQGFGAVGDLGDDEAGRIAGVTADPLAKGASGLALGAAGGLGRGAAALGLAKGVAGPGSRSTGGLARGTAVLGRGSTSQARGVAGLSCCATGSRGRGLASHGRSTATQDSGATGHGSGAAGLSSGTAGLGNKGDGLGSGMIGRFETDSSIGDAFLASQASATSGAQRRRRAASSKRIRDDEV
jgi:hypothetical protein